MGLIEYLHAVPKCELHVHLEGSIQPETLLELAKRNRVELPYTTVDGLRKWFIYRDFDHFIEVYLTITRCLRHAEDYELIAYEFGREMERQNIKYAEVTFSAGTHDFFGVRHDVYFAGLSRGRERARIDFGARMNWIFDIVRNASSRDESADFTTHVAIDSRHNGVVALGLGGKEAGHPPEYFERWFDMARDAGLHSAPHAGETDGPASIWGAIRALGAERIGHGVRAIEDKKLVKHLKEKKITLEINPTSNLLLGIYKNMEKHPFKKLADAGLEVTVNSDDPALFNTSLEGELRLVCESYGLTAEGVDRLMIRAVRNAFLPENIREKIEIEMTEEMNRLRAKFISPS